MTVEPLSVPPGDAVLELLPRLRRALEGGAPVAPHSPGLPPELPAHDPRTLPGDLAVVVGTSGSTGIPKRVMLGAHALAASAAATAARLSGHGQWLLTVPGHHVAGLQVLLRSLAADTTPVVVDLATGFSTHRFVEATALLRDDVPRYTSLVPTQLTRLLDDPRCEAALTAYDAILVGGAALTRRLRRRAEQVGARIVATYGMSETCGGCIYDGVALEGTSVGIDDGRILLGGDTLALGYLGRPDLTDDVFVVDADALVADTRWFITDDLGHLDMRGRLHVDGRADAVIITGGVKVAPHLVEEALVERLCGVAEAVVVGVADREWGEVVAALLVPAADPVPGPAQMTLEDARAALRGAVPDHALPRRVLVRTRVPERGPGKPDRRAVARLFDVGE